ncbi:MAG: hypothetical protein J6V41_01950 [Kiritimatiellae bacterium]|nr:hypothetical protein [Kiritimatiellia bacterium]
MANDFDLLSVINTLETSRGISKTDLLSAIKNAYATAMRKSIGNIPIRVEFENYKKIVAERQVYVSDTTFGTGFMKVAEARKIPGYEDANEGDEIWVSVPESAMNRQAVQIFRQELLRILRDAEKITIAERFRSRVGEIVPVTVKQLTRSKDYICNIEETEAILFKEDYPSSDAYSSETVIYVCIAGINETEEELKENILYRNGKKPDAKKVEAFEKKISQQQNIPGIRLTRTEDCFIKAIFANEVAEIKDGSVEIVKIARIPGRRTKVAVRSTNPQIDPIGACIGSRGSRIKSIMSKINYDNKMFEKVDIVGWDSDLLKYAENALSPAEIESIQVSETDYNTLLVRVDPSKRTPAIGREGDNIELAAKLLADFQFAGQRWRITIQKDKPAPVRSFEESTATAIKNFTELPGISEHDAEILVSNGFISTDIVTSFANHGGLEGFINSFIPSSIENDPELPIRVWNSIMGSELDVEAEADTTEGE